MLNIASRLLAQLRPQREHSLPVVCRAKAHHQRLQARCVQTWSRGRAALDEVRRRTRDAARDAVHRLRTGRARGIPTGFDVLVHPCTEDCSMSARQVHGLLLKYGERYQEVRLKVRTMGEILGWSEATLRHAIKELRERKLLDVEERVGHDKRRIANRYRAHVVAPAKGAPVAATRPPCGHSRGTSDRDRSRTRIVRAPSSNAGSRSEETNLQAARTLPTSVRAPCLSTSSAPAERGGVSQIDLEQALGTTLYRRLAEAHGSQLHALRTVAAKHRASVPSAMLHAAVEALLAERGSIANPPAYLVGILRRQRDQLQALRDEQAELEAQLAEMRAFDDPGVASLELKLARLGAQIAQLTMGERPPKQPPEPGHARPAQRARSRRPATPTPAVERPLVTRAEAARSHLSWAHAELRKLCARGACAADVADQQRRVAQLVSELDALLETARADSSCVLGQALTEACEQQLAEVRASLPDAAEIARRDVAPALRPGADAIFVNPPDESEATLQGKLHEATTFVRLIARLRQLRALHPAATRSERDEIRVIEHDLRQHLAGLERQLGQSLPRGRAAQLAAQAAAIECALSVDREPATSARGGAGPGLRKTVAKRQPAPQSHHDVPAAVAP